MKRAVSLTLIAAGVWALGSVWYFDCKVKRVCGPQEAATTSAAAAPAAEAPPDEVIPASSETAAADPAAAAPPEPTGLVTPAILPPAAITPLPELDNRESPTLVLRVSFDARSAALKPPDDVTARLELLQRGIAQGRKVLVLGHSDGLGARSRISVVSQQRADALRDWLLTQGIGAKSIASVESREDREPIASNTRPEGRSLNRRAEALLTPLPQE